MDQQTTLILRGFSELKKNEALHITVFPRLDSFLGGLRSSLYILGAEPATGKTTFVQEIADNIAAQGHHVLYFSLEMSKKELIAKSLVRTMGELKKEKQMTGEITYTKDLLIGDIKDSNLFMAAIGAYETAAKNLFFYEGTAKTNVLAIREEVEKHIHLHNKRPLVIVDYLQIIERLDDEMTDKQAIDKNVTELKRLSLKHNLPVIAISSFNRESYNRPASLSSLKESGAIEYSGDVVMVLEARKEQANNEVRDIRLKVLKNRFGKAFEEIKYQYITTMNKFLEEGTPKAQEAKRI